MNENFPSSGRDNKQSREERFDPTEFSTIQPLESRKLTSFAHTKLEQRRTAIKGVKQDSAAEKSEGMTSGYSLPLSARDVRSPNYNEESMFPRRSNQIKDIYNWVD